MEAKAKILYNKAGKTSNFLLVEYRQKLITFYLQSSKAVKYIKGNELQLDEEIDEAFYNAKPINEFTPICNAFIKKS